jgi:tRNA G10  N-methylase Trm11
MGRLSFRIKDLPDESVDAIITDPPAGIEFMEKNG